ncbi:MAG: hypothetical protein BWY17_03095 [Deltaproteobacteria bacterium ADurb.Bin207]|jgi:hypothetical protein|nr:MAG: hypothetical protein BWY17_03095 [Deltaproteobacteria bacterium ADurb.Bin207]
MILRFFPKLSNRAPSLAIVDGYLYRLLPLTRSKSIIGGTLRLGQAHNIALSDGMGVVDKG